MRPAPERLRPRTSSRRRPRRLVIEPLEGRTLLTSPPFSVGGDPIVNPARLVGSNREYLRSHLAHVGRLLSRRPEEAIEDADAVIVATRDAAALAAIGKANPKLVIDLDGRLGYDVEELVGYQGVCW